ncbi:MAG: hypothetical protein EBV44_02465, partial [Synechococcaceae bacterium WB7_1B_046]|nr:hypothetical protein [Synechococcaceae bacterium WB7_1B_046]
GDPGPVRCGLLGRLIADGLVAAGVGPKLLPNCSPIGVLLHAANANSTAMAANRKQAISYQPP